MALQSWRERVLSLNLHIEVFFFLERKRSENLAFWTVYILNKYGKYYRCSFLLFVFVFLHARFDLDDVILPRRI